MNCNSKTVRSRPNFCLLKFCLKNKGIQIIIFKITKFVRISDITESHIRK